MSPLFSEAGRARMDQLVQPGVLCVFDFDGTLVPITDRPEEARLPQNEIDRLIALSEYAPVAILTGRSVTDIRARLGFEPIYLVGNHGLEGVPGVQPPLAEHAAICRDWHQALAQAFTDQARFDPDIWIEDKAYSLSVHYRAAKNPLQAARRLEELFNTLHPVPRIIAGKAVFNLLPQDAADKGSALEQLLEINGATSAIYVGDDVTDEDVFRLQRDDLLTVRVEYDDKSNAEFFVETHAEVARLLDDLILRLQMQRAHLEVPHSMSGK